MGADDPQDDRSTKARPERLARRRNSEEPTIQLDFDEPLSVEPPELTLAHPILDVTDYGETTVVRRIHRRYGLVTAIAAVLVAGLAALAVVLLVIGLALQLTSVDPPRDHGPSLERALPER